MLVRGREGDESKPEGFFIETVLITFSLVSRQNASKF